MGNEVSAPSPVQDPSDKKNDRRGSSHIISEVLVRRRSSTQAACKDKDDSVHTSFQNVFSKPFHFIEEAIATTIHGKSRDVQELLHGALESTNVLVHFDHDELENLVSAMELYTVPRDTTIIRQGDVGDYFYVIERGSIDFVVDGEIVGSAESGSSFGELALFYNCSRAATCVAREESVLWRVDQQTFRTTLACHRMKIQKETVELLKKVSVLQDLNEEQLMKISDALVEKEYKEGETIIEKGTVGDEFYIIKSGQAAVTDIGAGRSLLVELRPGDFFGEKALISGDVRAANVMATTACVLKCMTRQEFTNVLGPLWNSIERSEIKHLLLSVPTIAEKNMSDDDIEYLASLMIEGIFDKNTVIYEKGDEIMPSLYVIVHGQVMKETEEEAELLSSGDCFGEELFREGQRSSVSAIQQPSSVRAIATVKVLKETKCLLLTQNAISLVSSPQRNIKSSISFTKPKVGRDRFRKHGVIHVGEFSQIWLVGDKTQDGKLYILKRFSKRRLLDKHQAECVAREVNILRLLDHPFIVALHTSFVDETFVYVTCGFCPGKDLFTSLDAGGLKEEDVAFYSACVLEGLTYLHRRKIIFRNIAPENLLLDASGYAVLNDFRYAKMNIVSNKTYTVCGPPLYLAPEIILQRGHDTSSDIWAFGVLLFELICDRNPFNSRDNTCFRKVFEANYHFPPNRFSIRSKNLIQSILQVKPSKRLGCSSRGTMDLREHKFFQSIDFDLLVKKQLPAPFVPEPEKDKDVANSFAWNSLQLDVDDDRPLREEEQEHWDKLWSFSELYNAG